MIKRNILECMTLVGKAPSHYEGAKTYVSTGAVDCDHIDYKQTEQVTYDNRPSRANLSVTSGDILFAKMCGTKKTLRINDVMAKYLFSTGFCAVRANESVMIADLLYHLLSSEQFLTQKDQNSSGATQKAITNTGLKKITIQVPDLEEQRVLAAKLDCIEQMMAKRRIQIEYFDQLVKSRFIELFGDPLHPVNSRALGDVAVLERGRFSPRPRNDPRYYGGDYPFIQTGDIAGCGHRLSEYRQTLNEKGIHVSKKFSAGTIVIAIVGATIGATAILEIDVYAPDSVIGISVNDELYNNVFMEALLQFWQPELVRIAPESARANINLRILQSIPIIDVELPRQLQFASFVEQTDKSKLAIQESLKRLEILKKSLMQKYFG